MKLNSAEAGFRSSVSRETCRALEIYEELLLRWNSRINLVSSGSLKEVWTRHFQDSAQLVSCAPAHVQTWADLGSGGGFPGIVVAILKRDTDDFSMTLVEADQRKAAFLRTVIRECGVSAEVISRRIEDVPPLKADVVSARALAPLGTLLGYAEKHLSSEGVAIFPKGEKSGDELAEAKEKWSYTCEAIPSVTNHNASILKIGDIQRV